MRKWSFFFVILISRCIPLCADVWIQKTDYPGVPTGGAIGFSINGKGYVGTGCCFEKGFWEYDPITDMWTQKADIGGAGRSYAAGFSIGGKGYIGSGQIGSNILTNDFWEYDPVTNLWQQKASVPGGPRAGAFAFTINEIGYLGGGNAAIAAKEDYYAYNPATDTWTQKADYGGGKRTAAAGFVIDGKAYIGTGRDNSLLFRKDFWEYDPTANNWIQKADFGGNVRDVGVGFSIAEIGYIGLGYAFDSVSKYFSDVWSYNPTADTWIQVSDYTGDAGPAALALSIGDSAWVGTGGTTGKQWWLYDPDSIATAVDGASPLAYSLTVYPNPVATLSLISFSLSKKSYTSMELLDYSNKKIKTLLYQMLEAGRHEVTFTRAGIPAGIYFLKIKINNASSVIKVIIQ